MNNEINTIGLELIAVKFAIRTVSHELNTTERRNKSRPYAVNRTTEQQTKYNRDEISLDLML